MLEFEGKYEDSWDWIKSSFVGMKEILHSKNFRFKEVLEWLVYLSIKLSKYKSAFKYSKLLVSLSLEWYEGL